MGEKTMPKITFTLEDYELKQLVDFLLSEEHQLPDRVLAIAREFDAML